MLRSLRPVANNTSILTRLYRKFSSSSPPTFTGPAFAFDIDGVLIRGGNVIPAAKPALHSLYDFSNSRWRVPVAFITNGGGFTEEARASRLSELFEVPVVSEMMVLAHSPLRQLRETYNKLGAVVTVGGAKCSHVARSYGFTNVIDTEAIAAISPKSTPFSRLDHIEVTEQDIEAAKKPVVAVFVMSDSRDWGRDIQILVDLLLSDGSPNRSRSGEQVVDVFFSNPDIVFPNEYHIPRLAGGTFCLALKAVYERLAGSPLRYIQYGKPHSPNYHLADSVLREQVHKLGFCVKTPLPAVYAIGDNPPSDVRGANAHGKPWVSVLVRTGNFEGENDEIDKAQLVLDNVNDAVKFGLQAHD